MYDSLCAGGALNGAHAVYGPQLTNLAADISVQNGGTAATCNAGGDEYCVSAPLASTGVICVDATGNTGTTACGVATACP